ncbi:MAG: single-stranded DNA-binding protein [Desulfocapsaceae bacterium]|nr:single-stranded DNA-binding protein [Desulfocapsaceae bacterium]
MMNKAMVIGNLGNDPEIRYSQKGTAVATFSIATTEKWKDAEGVQQEHTDWHRIVAWRGLAEICGDHLKKGSKIYIEGKMQIRKWEENGITRYTTEIIAKNMEMLGGNNFDKETDSSSAPHGNNPPLPEKDVPF